MKYTKSKLMRGYANSVLTIDLGTGMINASDLDPQLRDYFVGGRALGLYLLYKRVTPDTSPHAPENPLILPGCGYHPLLMPVINLAARPNHTSPITR